MRHSRTAVVLASLALAIAMFISNSAMAAPKITKDQALQLQKNLLASLQSGDWKTTDELMSAELVYIHPNGRVTAKSEEMDSLTKGPSPRWLTVEGKNTQAMLFGDAVVLTGEAYYTDLLKPGESKSRLESYKLTTVWANEHGKWRMVLWQVTTIPTPSS